MTNEEQELAAIACGKGSAVCIVHDKYKGEDGRFYAYVKKEKAPRRNGRKKRLIRFVNW